MQKGVLKVKRYILIFGFGLFFVLALYNLFSYEFTLNSSLESFRGKLKTIAVNASQAIDADTLLKIPLRADADKTEEYKVIYDVLLNIKQRHPLIKYIYIMTTTDEEGILQYVVDADPLPEIATAKGPTSFSGDKYDARNVPALLDAYKGPSADEEYVEDEWGASLSGYAPFYDKSGKAVAILGVDANASQLAKTRVMTERLLVITLITGILFLLSVIILCLKSAFRLKGPEESYT